MKEFFYMILILVYLSILFLFSSLLKPIAYLAERLRKSKKEQTGTCRLQHVLLLAGIFIELLSSF